MFEAMSLDPTVAAAQDNLDASNDNPTVQAFPLSDELFDELIMDALRFIEDLEPTVDDDSCFDDFISFPSSTSSS